MTECAVCLLSVIWCTQAGFKMYASFSQCYEHQNEQPDERSQSFLVQQKKLSNLAGKLEQPSQRTLSKTHFFFCSLQQTWGRAT